MANNLSYLMLEHPHYRDEIRLLNLYNAEFQTMAVEYQHLTTRIQALDESQPCDKLRRYQSRHQALNQTIQSMLVKHALAAKL